MNLTFCKWEDFPKIFMYEQFQEFLMHSICNNYFQIFELSKGSMLKEWHSDTLEIFQDHYYVITKHGIWKNSGISTVCNIAKAGDCCMIFLVLNPFDPFLPKESLDWCEKRTCKYVSTSQQWIWPCRRKFNLQ